MQGMKSAFSSTALLTALLFPALAAPEFAPALQSGMVLQREAPVILWGSARSGESITVEWKGQKRSARANGGRWQVEFPASAADTTGSSICATDSTGSSTLEEVLVGDVWLASGQSNMEWTMAQSTKPSASTQLNNPQVRLLRVHGLLHGLPGTYSTELYRKAADCGGCTWEWRVCSAATTRDFSAIATYFALRLQKEAGVPIGIICNAKGGSSMEAWIPRRVINKKRTYASLRGDKWLDSEDFDTWSRGRAKENLRTILAGGEKNLRHPFAPGYQYEVAIAPLARLSIRGVIWYQGESNADTPDVTRNATKMRDLIRAWQQTFRNDTLPFLMVQLPRINDPKRPHWSAFREMQRRVAAELPGVGLICTIDLGSTNSNVHPPHKEPVGNRLAELALSRVYGVKGLPTYPSICREESSAGGITLHFDQRLTTTDGQAPRGFVMGAPRKPESMTAVAATLAEDGKSVHLPAARGRQLWRYIDSTYAEPNLVSAESGLPAFPARCKAESGKP